MITKFAVLIDGRVFDDFGTVQEARAYAEDYNFLHASAKCVPIKLTIEELPCD